MTAGALLAAGVQDRLVERPPVSVWQKNRSAFFFCSWLVNTQRRATAGGCFSTVVFYFSVFDRQQTKLADRDEWGLMDGGSGGIAACGSPFFAQNVVGAWNMGSRRR